MYSILGESTLHMTPVQNQDQFAMQTRNKCFLMKIEQYLDRVFKQNCIKVSLRSILTEFQGLLSSITLNIITLPASAKSCHNEKSTLKPHTVKPRKEEPRKLRTNRLFLKILYPLVKNQCQGVLE